MTSKNTLEQKLNSYVGGVLEVQNQIEEYVYRGNIESIAIKKGDLNVKFSSVKKGVGYPPIPTGWVEEKNKDYCISLAIYSVSDIGNGRTCLQSHITNELAVLFPKDMERKED